jgi:hypothetical protein
MTIIKNIFFDCLQSFFRNSNKRKIKNKCYFDLKNSFLCVFFLIPSIIFSDELLERREAYILTKSSWQEVKAQEKKALQESKKEKRKIKKEVSRRIQTAEKNSSRYVSPNGDIFVNKLYDFNALNEFKGKTLIQIDDQPEQELTPNLLLLREGVTHD